MGKARSRRSLQLLVFLVLAAIVPSLVACGSGSANMAAGADLLSKVRQTGTLKVAITQANPPWNFLDSSGNPAGYDVDVAHELAKRLGVGEVEFVPSNFQSFIEGVRANRFDIVIAGQTITEERAREVGFSIPYQVNGISIFVPGKSSDVANVEQLAGKTVGVSAGTTQEEFARTKVPGAQVKTYQNATLGLIDLARSNADAMLVSRFQGAYLAAQNKLAVKPVGPLLESEVNGMSFRKDAGAFKGAVDQALTDMINDGTLTAISQRWLGGLDMASELRQAGAHAPR